MRASRVFVGVVLALIGGCTGLVSDGSAADAGPSSTDGGPAPLDAGESGDAGTTTDAGETADSGGPPDAAVQPLPCGQFSFRRDGAGRIVNYDELPVGVWVEVPDSQFLTQIKSALDDGGYSLYRYGSDGVAGTITNYNGMAWEPAGPYGYAHGGGHEGGSDNGIYRLDRRSMTWSVAAFPSRAGDDGLTLEDAELWGAGTRSPKTRRFAYARSSTGFAVKAHSSFSTTGWQEAPPGPVGPASVSAAEYATFQMNPQLTGPGLAGWPEDVMVDGRPTPRHVYGGLFTNGTELYMASRAFWRARLDGSGWVTYQRGGRTPFTRYTGEVIWSFLDERSGKLWQGGCGSNCWVEGYFYYGAALVFEPSTSRVEEVGGLLPAGAQPVANLGDRHLVVAKVGREVYALMSTGYSISFNLDTPERALFRAPLTDAYAGAGGEGRAGFFLPGTKRLWIFDTSDPRLAGWEYDFTDPAPGAPFDPGHNQPLVPTRVPRARRLTLGACAGRSPPTPAQGLVYNRMAPWEGTGLIVYVPVADGNVWVLRPSLPGQ